MITLLDRACHRSGLAITHPAEVDLTQADHLGRRTADKDLIRGIELIARDGLLEHIVAQVLGNGMDGVAGDAL